MKKLFLFIFIFFIAAGIIFSQDNVSLVQQLDASVKELAGNIHKKFTDEKAQKIAFGLINYRGTLTPLSTYWINQLTNDLINTPNRSYNVLSIPAGAEWTITGEIVDVAGTIRIYTRLIRTEGRTIEGAFQSDFEKTGALSAMLTSQNSGGSSSSGQDEYEPDSYDSPVLYEIGADESSAVLINRAIQPAGDEDFFLLVPDRDGRLVMETTGNTDTYMEFFDAETRELLAEDDDGGQGYNARIRYNVQEGHRYIVKVRGYNNSTTGAYAFRAYMPPLREGANSWENPIPYEIGADDGVTPMNRTLERDDEDYFLILPESDGRLTMETTGNDMDTYMEFFDAETRRMLAEDDDSGQGYNARIRYNVEAGKRYIAKVRGYDGEGGRYAFRAYMQVQVRLEPDEYEPDDDPSNASWIEIGTSQVHTFHTSDDVDWVKFQVTRPGRHTIRTRGVNSNRLDTYIELFDANLNAIAEDDDGGENLDSRLSVNPDNGLYYLKVWFVGDEPEQAYTIRIDRE